MLKGHGWSENLNIDTVGEICNNISLVSSELDNQATFSKTKFSLIEPKLQQLIESKSRTDEDLEKLQVRLMELQVGAWLSEDKISVLEKAVL